MNRMTNGMLLVWTDIPADVEPQFNEWYNREHLPERVRLPGFVRGRRFVAYSGALKYAALYEAESTAVFGSQPYVALKTNRDPGSLQFVPKFRNTRKALCDVVSRAGEGEGACVALLPTSRAIAGSAAFREWIDEILPRLVRGQGIVAAAFARANREGLELTARHDTRGDCYLDDVILIEGASESGLANAVSGVERESRDRFGAMPLVEPAASFRVIYTLHSRL